LQGIGFNVTNAAPTTSINHVLEALNHRRNANGQESLKPYTQETLLACILVAFEELHARFYNNGWDKHLEDLYHKNWLHRYVIRPLIYLPTRYRAMFRFL
jgi:biotin---protein ligase